MQKLIPIFYAAMRFVFGCIGAIIYKLVAGKIGSLRFELRPVYLPAVLAAPGSQNV